MTSSCTLTASKTDALTALDHDRDLARDIKESPEDESPLLLEPNRMDDATDDFLRILKELFLRLSGGKILLPRDRLR